MMAHPMICMIRSHSSQVRWTLNFMTAALAFSKICPAPAKKDSAR